MKKISLTLLLAVFFFFPSRGAFAQWSSDPMLNLGVAVKADDQVQPKIRPTPDGGCYISWFDNDPTGHPPFGYDVDMQRLDASGVAQWAAGGIRFADLGMSSTQDYGLDVDAQGNALLAFLDDRRPITTVATMKVDPTGIQHWGPKGSQVAVGPDFLGNPKITAANDGTAVAGWIQGNNIKFQRISPAGRLLWGPTGITITAPAGLT
jgi:hypothetical protein